MLQHRFQKNHRWILFSLGIWNFLSQYRYLTNKIFKIFCEIDNYLDSLLPFYSHSTNILAKLRGKIIQHFSVRELDVETAMFQRTTRDVFEITRSQICLYCSLQFLKTFQIPASIQFLHRSLRIDTNKFSTHSKGKF